MDRRVLLGPALVLAAASGTYFWNHADQAGRMVFAGMVFFASVAAIAAVMVAGKEPPRG